MARPTAFLTRNNLAAPHARVMQELRGNGPTTRADLARITSLSPATVSRAVTGLLAAHLVAERPDLVTAGSVGRPSAPLQITGHAYVGVAVHHGLAQSTVALCDLRGQLLASNDRAHPWSSDFDAADVVARMVALLADRGHPTPIGIGFVAPWRDLSHAPGRAAGSDPELTSETWAHELATQSGLPVRTSEHVAAVAAAEFIHRRHGEVATTAYLYVRNAAGFVVASEHSGRTQISNPASLTHFPLGTDSACPCGRTGCVGSEVSDAGLAARHGAPIEQLYTAAATGDPTARAILHTRADHLGRLAAIVHEMVDPERLILVGQAFTGFAPLLGRIVDSFHQHASRPTPAPSFTRFGPDVQALAAATVALAGVYESPLEAVGQAPRSWRCPGLMPEAEPRSA